MIQDKDIGDSESLPVCLNAGPVMTFRGDWNPYSDYGYQNCVTVKNGLTAGLYIANNYVNAHERCPSLNNKWTKIASFDVESEVINLFS